METNIEKERIDKGDPEIITELFLAPYRYFSAMFWEGGYKTMLDIGCGNGIGTEIMRKYFKDVIGVDKEMLVQEPHFIQGDATNLKNFEDNSFDGCFCFETIEHLNEENQKKCISELYRVSKKGFVVGSVNKEGPNTVKGVEIWKGAKNKFHLKELTIQDFEDIASNLKKKYAQLYGSKYYKREEMVRVDVLVQPYSEDSLCNYVKIIK